MESSIIDTQLYSRQLLTIGMKAHTKVRQLNVLIVGMRGLGFETAKNLILMGPASVTIIDSNLVAWGDLSSNLYLSE